MRLIMKTRSKIDQLKSGDNLQVMIVAVIWIVFFVLMFATPAKPKQKTNYWRTHDRFTHGAAAKFY